MNELSAGDLVIISYKTGEYVAEMLETSTPKALVKILAVGKHPTQGDLHNPNEVDVPLFHQRRALSFQEKVMVPIGSIHRYRGSVLSYQDSLSQSVQSEIAALQKTIEWAKRSLVEYEGLQKEYFPKQ